MGIKPILFNTEMIRAIMDGRKTVTRRVIKPQPSEALAYIFAGSNHGKWGYSPYNESRYEEHRAANDWEYWTPPYHGDDMLWVRETWFYERHMEDLQEGEPDLPSGRYSARYIYRADQPDYPVNVGVFAGGWRPSIHMPKEAARIFLRVTDVRVERLNAVCNIDMESEGISACLPLNLQKKQFGALWDSTIKPADLERYGWTANPWVWVIEFERCEKPEEE